MLTKGILIFALGHQHYGRYAYNLAITIKAMENISVALVYDQSAIAHLDSEQISLFDHLVHAPHLKPGCGVKLSAYDLTPFDHTLVLDADMLWLPRRLPTELFKDLEGKEFTAIYEGDSDNPAQGYFFWADLAEIREKYNVEKVGQWRTEVMYFEKGVTAFNIFEKAKSIYQQSGLKTVKKFAEGIPDELGINIACAIYGVEGERNFAPSYWPAMYGHQIPGFDELYTKYYLFSVGGNMNTENTKLFYNRIMKARSRNGISVTWK